jgi:hypothetical protein
VHRILLLACLITYLLTARASADVSPQRAVSVPRTTAAIAIDGKLDEPAWGKAGRIPSFVEHRSAGPLRNQTEVLLLYDDKALYIAYKCADKDMPRIKADTKEHDGSVWEDDCAEIFLDAKGDRAGFVHFILNTMGTKYDALGNDSYGYDPDWEGRAHLGTDGWTAEIRIPFGELGAPVPRSGDSWLGNFCREEQPAAELSCWSATYGSFDAPARFGEIVFGSLALKSERDIERSEKALAEIEKSVASAKISAPDVVYQARTSLKTAKSLLGARGSLTEAQYLEIASLLGKSRTAQGKLGELVRRAEMGNPEYLVWETTPWRHFSAKEDCSGIRQDTTSVQALVLAGQTESKALMLSNLTEETLSARLLLDGFPKDSVEILIPTFVRSADGSEFPDALIPPDPIGQLIVPPGETRQVWVNIRSANPGKFEGTITINPLTASKTDKQVKVAIEAVQPPKPLTEPLAFTWDYLGDAVQRGLEKEYVRTMADHGIRVFMISGLHDMPRPKADDDGNLLEPMDWSKFESQVKLKWMPGRKLYIIMDVWEKSDERKIYNGKFDSPGWRIAFKKVIAEMVSVLKNLGLSYDDYMVNPVDECIDDRYIAIARLVKEVDPKIKLVEDTIGGNLDQVKEADKYTDYWTPHLKAFQAESAKPSIDYLKSTGKPLGFYFYSEGANEKAQDSYRHYLWDFWYAYSQGLNGIFGYWTATQHYGDPWNRHQTSALYDPSLFYYGNGCVITGRRWEAWRRGIEDLALLRLCESAGVDKAVISEAVKSVLDAPTDPNAAAKARQRLIRSLAFPSPH